MTLIPTFEGIALAQARVQPYIVRTPLVQASGLPSVYLKLENLQRTRSFKVRGALNKLLTLSREERAHGIVAVSAGNHAQGVGYGAQMLGLDALVVMPEDTPEIKVKATRAYGVEVLLEGESYDEAEARGLALARERGRAYVSPYNDAAIIAGQGTIALEILADLPDVTQVLVPVGGGGLAAGIGLALRALKPDVRLIGINSRATPAMYNELKGTQLPQRPTLAEGMAGGIEAGSITIPLARQLLDDIVLVEEADLAAAMVWTLREHGWAEGVVEGSAAAGLAALLSGVVRAEGPTVAVVSGGNVDFERLKQVLCSA
jgi:threonine dehydratase